MRKTPQKKTTKTVGHTLDVHTNEDVKRYIGAVSEHFEHQVSAVAEQFLGLNEKIDRIDNKIDAVEQRLSTKIDLHTEMIGRLMIDVEEIKTGMHEKIDRAEFNKLEMRLVALESIVFSGQGKMKTKKL